MLAIDRSRTALPGRSPTPDDALSRRSRRDHIDRCRGAGRSSVKTVGLASGTTWSARPDRSGHSIRSISVNVTEMSEMCRTLHMVHYRTSTLDSCALLGLLQLRFGVSAGGPASDLASDVPVIKGRSESVNLLVVHGSRTLCDHERRAGHSVHYPSPGRHQGAYGAPRALVGAISW